VAEEGERDVQVLARDEAAVAQLARLPCGEQIEGRVGEPQRTEEPKPFTAFDASREIHSAV
jgi:hypothetical protein